MLVSDPQVLRRLVALSGCGNGEAINVAAGDCELPVHLRLGQIDPQTGFNGRRVRRGAKVMLVFWLLEVDLLRADDRADCALRFRALSILT
jgi:hypothetical protein